MPRDGGTLIANRLRRMLDRGAAEIVVIDPDDEHLYQPGLLFVPFGKAEAGSLTRPRHRQFRPGVTFRQAAVDRVDLDKDEVLLADGTPVGYDVLVIATGARLVPEETEGLTGPGWMDKVFTFYTLDGAVALRRRSRSSAAAGWPWRCLTCRSSARSRRWSSAYSPTPTSASAASGTRSS